MTTLPLAKACKFITEQYEISHCTHTADNKVVFTNASLQGDPSAVPYAVQSVQELLGQKPIFGICMGHQLLGQAFGGKTFKLKFGHHGGNHPVRHNASGKA